MLYPITNSARTVISLDGIWNFCLGEEELDVDLAKTPIKNAMPMPVPCSFNDINEGERFRDHYGWMWYEREFCVPSILTGQRLVLRFDAVTHQCKVFLNGEEIAQNVGGFTPFEVDVTSLVKPTNRLTVAVSTVIDQSTLPVGGVYVGKDASGREWKTVNPNMDFFNYCGITRSVRLCAMPKEYISNIAITTSIDPKNNKNALVGYSIDTQCGGGAIAVKIVDQQGNVVSQGEGANGTLTIKNAVLWQPLKAYLYSLVVSFGKDEYTEPFGVRTVEVKDGKFLINSKPFYFKGFGKHEDAHVTGRGLNLPYYVKDINLMKWLGANSLRTSHYPYSEEFLRLCDSEGIVVIDECAAVGLHYNLSDSFGIWQPNVNTWQHIKTFESHITALKRLVLRDKNHPCVVMWSIANESAEGQEGAYEYFKPLFDLVRKLDPTRPVTNVTLADYKSEHSLVAPLVDVVCLNRYYGWYTQQGDLVTAQAELEKEIEGWISRYPTKPILFTEFGADAVAGVRDTTPVMFTEEYQRDFISVYCQSFDKFPQVIGEHIWNFADFYAVQGIKRVQGNRKGVFTRERKPKLSAHWLKDRWHKI